MTVARELSVEARHVTSFCVMAYRAVSVCTGHADELAAGGRRSGAAVGAGIAMMPYSKPAFLALPSCQVPFSAKA